ncbi:hypothetical protein FDECE_12498 [Fusarium decemcellulare]|nr:hypothetical protein FDECE_12498 [Fusarium decemcellulare]
MELPETLEALTVYPSAAADAPDGKYAICTSEEREVESSDSEIKYTRWFTTPLFTESHDQGFCDNEAAGIWTWFEVAIMDNADATTPRAKDDIQLAWTSHKNVLKSNIFAWLQGILFSKDHDLFRLLETCSRFKSWKLTARRGYLVVELGSPVKREPLNFGPIAGKVVATQAALNDINEAICPNRDELPSVPPHFFKAEMTSTASANDRPLRVLSLDGGGVRGLASLLMLKKVMDTSCPGKKPCEVFDMIAGTSTGGLIAIMLGRLEMSVDGCITTYNNLMGEVFPTSGGSWEWFTSALRTGYDFVFKGGKWDAQGLENAVKQLVSDKLNQDPETVLLRDDKNPNPSCKVFVTAVASKGSNTNAPVLFRSYTNHLQMPDFPDIKLWQAARATSAAPYYFKPLEINGQTFVDGGLQANNPLGWLWNEVLQVFGPLRTTDCFLSIGTGIPLSETLPGVSNPVAFAEDLSGITTNSDVVNILFRSLINAFAPRGMAKKYWRFNFGDGLPDWVGKDGVGRWRSLAKREESNLGELDDVNIIEITKQRARDYMNDPNFTTPLHECVNALRGVS